MTMIRTIKPGPRPFVAVGIVFGLMLFALATAALAGPAKPSELLKAGGFLLALYAAISLSIWRPRLVVSAHSIALQPAFGRSKEVRVHDISGSVAEVLAEPDHPVALHIFGAGTRTPLMSLPLKPYRKEDVSWLLQLPGLRRLQRTGARVGRSGR